MPPNASVIRSPTGAWQCLREKINWGQIGAIYWQLRISNCFVTFPHQTHAGEITLRGRPLPTEWLREAVHPENSRRISLSHERSRLAPFSNSDASPLRFVRWCGPGQEAERFPARDRSSALLANWLTPGLIN